MLFAESGSFWVIVDGYFSNPISTAELDMRVSSHPAPREQNARLYFLDLINKTLNPAIY